MSEHSKQNHHEEGISWNLGKPKRRRVKSYLLPSRATNLDAREPLLLAVADKRVLVLDTLHGDAGPLEGFNVHKRLVDMRVLLHHV